MSQKLYSSSGFEQRTKSYSNQGVPSESFTKPSFLTLKNQSEILERSPEFQVSTVKGNKSKNLDDSQEISKRLSQLRLSLGLSESKVKRKLSDENSPMNREADYLDLNPEVRELSRYLTEYSNQKKKEAQAREFATTFGTKHHDLEFSPQDEVNQGSMIVKSKYDHYDEVNTSFKKKAQFNPSDIEASHFNSSQIEALLSPDSKSRETDLMLIEDPKERFEKLAYHFQNENELLRQRIEEEQNFYKQQMTVLSTRMDEYKRSLNFEKQSESLLKENTSFYKNQIEELEKMINELNSQLEDSKSTEKELSDALEQSKMEFKVKEENYMKQIRSLQQEVEVRKNTMTTTIKSSSDGFDGSISKDQYVRQLETDIKFLKSLTDDLNNRKTQAEEKAENLERDLKNIHHKVGREIEKKFKQEIDEKTFMIESLKRENDTLVKLQKGNLDGSRVISESNASHKEHHQSKKSKAHHRDEYKGHSFEEIIVNLELKINELENNNFALHEKTLWLDTQLQAALNKKETKLASQTLVQTNEVYERRCKTLTDAVLFWKDKSFRLTSDFFKAFQELREENEKMKKTLLDEVSRFEGEVFDSVRKIKTQYKKENGKILDIIEELEEKHHQNQAKLAEARSKYKNLALTAQNKEEPSNGGKRKKKLLM